MCAPNKDMARPTTSLISRRATLQAALTIIDDEGLDSLTIRRLGEALSVHGTSLYHYFKTKDEIVAGAAELALNDLKAPDNHDEPWPIWMAQNAVRTRAALMRHPNLIPAVLARAPLGIGTRVLEVSAHRLEEQGVPVELILPLVESLEVLAISSALYATRADSSESSAESTYQDHPTLLRAQRARVPDTEAQFADVVDALIASVRCQIGASHTA